MQISIIVINIMIINEQVLTARERPVDDTQLVI